MDISMPEKPDLRNRKNREYMYNAYLRKNKPFWYYLNRGCLIVCGLSVAVLLIVLTNQIYSGYLVLLILIIVVSFIVMMVSRYKLDGSLSKPWWELY